jgi:hypothetical protein
MKNGVFWDVKPLALVRISISEERSASFIRVRRIGELGTRLTVTKKVTWYFFASWVGCYLYLALFRVHRFLSP